MYILTARYISIYMYILNDDLMRKVNITVKNLRLSENVIVIMEKKVTPYGNGAKVDCAKEYIGKRAYVVIVKD